jgi:hypothetical protein
MPSPHFRFSPDALLLTAAVVAGDLALTFLLSTEVARITLILAVFCFSALVLTGLAYGQPAIRSFCIGAVVPLAPMLYFISTNLAVLADLLSPKNDKLAPFRGFDINTTLILSPGVPRLLGLGILLSIALGFLCVGMHWLCSEREESETAGPSGRLQPADSMVPSRRRWIQFSLRTLFVLTTALAIWLGFVVKAVREQREAVKAIEALGGVVQYDWEEADFDPNSRTWLRRIVGDDYFQEASHVAFEKWPPPSDVALLRLIPYLQRFQRLQFLTVPQSVAVQMEAALHCDVLTVVPPGPASLYRPSQDSPEK